MERTCEKYSQEIQQSLLEKIRNEITAKFPPDDDVNIESSEAHKILDHDDMACALGLVTPSSENTIYGTESTIWSTQAAV